MRISLTLWLAVQPLILAAAAPVGVKSTTHKPVVHKAVARKPVVRKHIAAKPIAEMPIPADFPELEPIGYPLAEVKPGELHSEFNDHRRGHRHHAIDLMRPRGTPVLAVTDGTIRKLYRSKTGGISVYLFDKSEKYVFFYAHLNSYKDGLREGQEVHKGDLIAYVGHTGNAPRNAPHLHFAVALTGPQLKWSGGIALDPCPMLVVAAAPHPDADPTVVASDANAGDPDGLLITSAP